jgi:Rrf2 family iron-sulfur cluster assembly transcriptional regulator
MKHPKRGIFMRITTRGRYALRASLALAKLGEKGSPISINTLSTEENISPVFLEQIFFKLKKAGIVTSIRGPGGGFRFSRALDQLTVRQILEAAGEDIDITFCDKHSDDCERVGECLSHQVWADANEQVKNYFSGITILSILEKYDKTTNPEAGKY